MNRIGQLVCAFWGPGMVVFFAVGAVWLSGYWPPAILPGASAVEVLQWYQANNTRLKVDDARRDSLDLLTEIPYPWGC